ATPAPVVPADELRRRLAGFQQRLVADDIAVAVIAQNADLHYFSGSIVAGYMVIPASGEPALLLARAVERTRLETCFDDVRHAPSTKHLASAVTELGAAGTRIALELDVLPTATYLKLRELLPDAQFVDATHHIRSVRAVKSEWELALVRRAAKQVTNAMAAVMPKIVPGMREVHVAYLVEAELRLAGHQGIMRMRRFNGEMFFGQICAGANAALPAALDAPLGGSGQYPSQGKGASARELVTGDLLILDLMGAYNGYLSDCTRVIAVGGIEKVDADLLAGQQWCTDLLAELVDMVRPGITASSLHEHALARAEADGYADKFMGVAPDQARFIGHGIGLEVDEYPFLAKGYDTELEAGMVIAIEPKLVFPGRAAVGIEDAVIVTESGAEVLNAVSRDVYDGHEF
ncbi:MAG: aminopeptidase P family protein, partial [Thermoleophilia bacterium]|nr:aminopeptidase P family protein [Thermoleophilia bacterium]